VKNQLPCSSKRLGQKNPLFQNQPLLIYLGICSGFSLKRVRYSGRLFSLEIQPSMEAYPGGRLEEDEGLALRREWESSCGVLPLIFKNRKRGF